MSASENASATSKKRLAKTLVKIVGVVAIIAFFSAFYCWGFWDVMGAMKNYPVGIVNLDRGTGEGEDAVNFGESITDAALESEDATFVKLDADALDNGIQSTDYLIVVEIPADFSERVTSGQDGLPTAADLTIYKNERYNFIYSQFASRITSALETSIYQQIAKAYVSGAYNGLYTARDGMSDAADGAQQLADGSETLQAGLESATEGAQTAADGAESLSSGASTLSSGTSSLSSGATTLASGTATLSEGAAKLAAGTQTLAEKTSALPSQTQALSDGVSAAATNLGTAATNVSKLQGASSSVAAGLATLSAGLSSGSSQLSTAQTQMATLSAGLATASSTATSLASGAAGAQQYYQAAMAYAQAGDLATAAQLAAQGEGVLNQVSDGASALSASLSNAATAAGEGATGIGSAAGQLDAAVASIGSAETPGETLAYAAGQVDAGLTSLSSGLASSQSSMSQLSDGASALASASTTLTSSISDTNDGAQQLSAGASDASSGAATLASGAASLDSGATTLASGALQLSGKLPSLVSGLGTATYGTAALTSGANTLQSALAQGVSTMSESLHASADEMGTYIKSPVTSTTETYGKLDYYGQGFSPFFMTTALWLGSLLIFFVIDPLCRKRKDNTRLQTVLGRLPLYAAVCALEAAAVTACAFAIGVADAYSPSPLLFFGTALGISLCFMLMMQFLNMTFGLVGKAIAVLVLILQLACGGGTLPTVLGADLLSTLQPWLPFTYSIDALREVITYADVSVILTDLARLAGMGLVCLALSLVCWPLAEKRRDTDAAEYMEHNVLSEA